MVDAGDNFTSITLAGRPESDSSTPFMQWAANHGRYDLCEHLKISVHPGERTTLGEIRTRSATQEMPVYDGVEPSVIASKLFIGVPTAYPAVPEQSAASVRGGLLAAVLQEQLGMVFKTPVKPEWHERGMAGTMAS